jgi:hypothetical protein
MTALCIVTKNNIRTHVIADSLRQPLSERQIDALRAAGYLVVIKAYGGMAFPPFPTVFEENYPDAAKRLPTGL